MSTIRSMTDWNHSNIFLKPLSSIQLHSHYSRISQLKAHNVANLHHKIYLNPQNMRSIPLYGYIYQARWNTWHKIAWSVVRNKIKCSKCIICSGGSKSPLCILNTGKVIKAVSRTWGTKGCLEPEAQGTKTTTCLGAWDAKKLSWKNIY